MAIGQEVTADRPQHIVVDTFINMPCLGKSNDYKELWRLVTSDKCDYVN